MVTTYYKLKMCGKCGTEVPGVLNLLHRFIRLCSIMTNDSSFVPSWKFCGGNERNNFKLQPEFSASGPRSEPGT